MQLLTVCDNAAPVLWESVSVGGAEGGVGGGDVFSLERIPENQGKMLFLTIDS